MVAIDLSKQQAPDSGPNATQQINLTGNLHQDGNTTMFFLIGEATKTILDFLQGTVGVLWIYFALT